MQNLTPSLTFRACPPKGPDHLSDDDLAATQQSILEELHTISEEALTDQSSQVDNLNINSEEHTTPMQAVIAAMHQSPHTETKEPHVSDSEAGSQEDEEFPTSTFLEDEETAAPATAVAEAFEPLQMPANVEAVPVGFATGPIVCLDLVADETEPSATTVIAALAGARESETGLPKVTEANDMTVLVSSREERAEAQTDPGPDAGLVREPKSIEVTAEPELLRPVLDAAAHHAADLVLPEPEPIASELLSPSDIKMEVDTGAELDHTDLFDGIDADAFDDIELSPPVRRQAVLPTLDGALRSDPNQDSTSPTRIRVPLVPQPSAGLDLFLGGQDGYPEEHLEMPEASQMQSFLDPCFAGFKTGHGKQVKPSEKALEAARKLLLDLDSSQDLLPQPATSQLRARAVEMPPSEQQLRLYSGFTNSKLDRAPMQEIAPPQVGSTHGSQAHLPLSLPKPKAASAQAPTAQALPSSQVARPTFATQKPIRRGLFPSSQALQSPLRTPGGASVSQPTTPQSSRRIGLGMTPSAGITGRKRTLPKFVTPFKAGKRPKGDELDSPASPLRGPNNTALVQSRPSPVVNRQYPPPASLQKVQASNISKGPAVFLMQVVRPRQKLSDVGRPEYYSSLQMIAKGVPDEVLVILNDAFRASQYAFEATDGKLLQQSNALDELLSRGCTNTNLAWVQNHWTLILWKLAATVRLEPSSAVHRWSWDEVVRQLLYRYEREVHLAQRSCLKRIQEHDSSPSRPMILFVTKIIEEETEVQERSGEIVTRKATILELSDGWYRVQAQIDPVLASACQRGRLRVGHKLAIMGAMLDAQGEGNEVLAAYHMSSLVLASNSVSLARWDAKLGFAPQPFISSLRSLTAEGGLVSLMDVVITKVFPHAYVDAERSSSKPGNPRGEQEEAEEREAWTKKREDAIAQLELQMETENRRAYDLVEALSDVVGDGSFLPDMTDDPSGRLESMAGTLFDQLRAQDNPASAVSELVIAAGHSALVPWLHNFAKSALLEGETFGGGSGLAGKLDRLCPPRKVREFRVVRFRDARLPPLPRSSAVTAQGNGNVSGAKRPKNPYARSVQLTIWDAAQLGDELQEGRRFLVTNLVPSSKSSWRKADDVGDVFLSTRRDTKWRMVSES
ncbi:related to Rad51-associated protein Brh2 [Melanopsichium pennsylvanicum]|uniref:Related to Rad51-associated protein Brh2 n=2 Tax=Melanopsichium pennsylvanicum TaxID=63383 RepID=A0AAJ5C5S4_9BASI|nr:Rad51-associated protein Brh2 [Melanopsichium pennsylvanicum 4]SNX85036.1 related to Rad51-associated protein Brh2 [Melanopsichium pennsylvanicum]